MAEEQEQVELWESQIEGTTWVWKRNPISNQYESVRVGGTGSKRIQLTERERAYNESLIPEENLQANPFRNGTLVQVVDGQRVGLTNSDLIELVSIKGDAFYEEVRSIDNELTIRRLLEVVEENGTVKQFEFVKRIIEERYKVGGTQPTVQEMITAGELVTGRPLS